MKLIHKLVLGYLIISSFSVVTTFIAIRSFQNVERTFDNLTNDVVPEIGILRDMKSARLGIVSSTYEIIALRSEGEADVEQQIAAEQAQIRNAADQYQQSLASYEELARKHPNREYSSSDEAGFANAMRAAGQQLLDTSASLIAAKNAGMRGAEMAKRRDIFEKAEADYAAAVEAALANELKDLSEASDVRASIAAATKKTILVASATLILGLTIGSLTAISISRRIRRLQAGTVEVSQGNFDISLDDQSKDEIGGLAHSFNLMTRELSEANAALRNEISERKQLEVELIGARDAALRSTRLKSEFLSNMSHEIRTPMNGVIGMTGLLLETDLSPSQREYTETIQLSAEALLTIINDVLDFSKIEAGLLHFEKIDFELRGAVETPVELLAERAQAKGLELASLVHRNVPTALRGDPGRLRQVLTNLIGNAVKFTDRGEVVLMVKKVSETDSHAMLRFEVQDSGIGISAEAQKGLFHAFTQADGSTTRKYGGTGLGLAISKQLVELMGGEIGIESTPGVGSTFWFTARFEKQITPAKTTREPVGNLSGTRVLIVDDNAANRRILNHQTSSWGMIAIEAESGRRALELLREGVTQGQPYDIAVLDLMMPDMDGFQLAEVIKSDPIIASVALVLLPSFGKRGHGERAKEIGIAAYLQKPVRQSQLYNCLTEVMARSESVPTTAPDLVTLHSMRETQVQDRDKTFSTVSIIVAEDNPVNQKVALGQLYNLGYRAEVVANGRELLKALENNPVDIILMDCQMPELDGFAAAAEIRRREGTTRHTTIIAMTANALDGDSERCLAAGMDDYMSKPVKSEMLRQKLERWAKPVESGKGSSEVNAPRPGGSTAAQRSRPEPSIDQTQLASLREIQRPGATDFLAELIDLYLRETTLHLKSLHEALIRNDSVEMRRVAHCLKGSSANIGATRLAALSEELESQDAAGDTKALLEQLENEFELVREALEAECK